MSARLEEERDISIMIEESSTPALRRRRRSRGITLLELLVVLAILALIATFAAPQVLKLLGGARTDAAKVQIDNIGTALDLYRLQVGRYPSESEGLEALLERPADAENWDGPYLTKRAALSDPWGRPYRYRDPGEHGEYDLFTLGADDAEGGEGEDEDVTSW